MNNMKKRVITIQLEFFHNQDPEYIENRLRELQHKKQFPPFGKCLIMVHYKNLRQIGMKEKFPLIVDDLDAKELTFNKER